MVHVLQLWYMCYSYDTWITVMVHVLQLWYMYYSYGTCLTATVHGLQLWYMFYSYGTCVIVMAVIFSYYGIIELIDAYLSTPFAYLILSPASIVS